MSSQTEQSDTPVGDGVDEVAEGLDALGVGGESPETTPSEGGISDGEDTEGGGRSLLDGLWNTEPDTPLEQIESPWNPEEGGMARVWRGVQKLGDISGLPAIVDIGVGVLEEMHNQGQFEDTENDTISSEGEVEW